MTRLNVKLLSAFWGIFLHQILMEMSTFIWETTGDRYKFFNIVERLLSLLYCLHIFILL